MPLHPHTDGEPPCSECGQPVYLRTVEHPRAMAEKTTQTGQVRTCTNPACATNSKKMVRPKP